MRKIHYSKFFAVILSIAMIFTQAGFVFADDTEMSGETCVKEAEQNVTEEVSAPEPEQPAPVVSEPEPTQAASLEQPAAKVSEAESVQAPAAEQEQDPAEVSEAEESVPEETQTKAEESVTEETQTKAEESVSEETQDKAEIPEVQTKSKEDNNLEINQEEAIPVTIDEEATAISDEGSQKEDGSVSVESDNGTVELKAVNKNLKLKAVKKKAKMAAAFEFDNSTTLADGEYTADDFTFEFTGGTGKARLELEKITVTGGKAEGTFSSTSTNMTHVYLKHTDTNEEDTSIYDPSTDTMASGVYKIIAQKVTMPVKVNSSVDISCRTTAMTVPHWVKYSYNITIEEPEKTEDQGEAQPGEEQSEEEQQTEEETAGFDFDNSTSLSDGTYSADDIEFTFEGGTGKARLECESVTVKDGKAVGTFVSTSTNMTHVYLAKTPTNDEDPTVYDAEKDVMAPGVYKITDQKVTIPVKVGKSTDIAARTTAMSVPHWINYQYTLNIKAGAAASFDNSTTLKDGTYTPDGYEFKGGTGKARLDCVSVTVKDGKAEATFTASSDKMTHVYLGEAPSNDETPELYDPAEDKCGKNVYPISEKTITIPVRINEEVDFAARTTAMSAPHWVNYTYVITINSEEEAQDEEPAVQPGEQGDKPVTPAPEKQEEQTPEETKVPSSRQKLEDGTYKVLTTTDRKMFYIYPKEQDPAYSILKIEDGKMTATITLTGEGYDMVYMGTPEEAVKAGKSQWIKAKIVNGYYTFTIPVSKLDKKLAITPHSKKYEADPEMRDQAWRPDKWIKFYSGDAIKIKDGAKSTAEDAKKKDDSKSKDDESTGKTSGKQTEFKNDNKKDKVSKYKDDSGKSTSAVDSSTTLKDGVYTPDSFSWSGGSGRLAYIRCNKITVTGGQAYATIEFGSSSYDSLKANGRVYSKSGGGNSTFVIPVNLNANNTIIGRTTAMSQPHWVKYNIYIGKAETKAAAAKAKEAQKEAAEAKVKMTENAPEIMGLTYESTTEVEYAKYFRIFNYEGGVKLLSVDLTADTALKEEYTRNAEAAVKASENEDGLEYDDEGNIIAKSAGEYTEALYHNNVINYLLVPEDFEVPAGLDKEYVIITIPSEKTFSFSPEANEFIENMNKLDAITLLGIAEEDISSDALKDAVKEEKTVLAGDLEKPDYAKAVKEKPDLAILPGELLPEEIDEKADNKADLETEAEEMKAQLEKLESRFTALDVPVLIDRSAQEEEDLAKAEWVKVYGALYGCEEEAAKLFDSEVKKSN